jgi:site-specific recombinase XerD
MENRVLELDKLIQLFHLSCQIERKSPRTIEWYASFLGRFRRFLEQQGLPVRVDEISITSLQRFVLYLEQDARTPQTGKPLSGATIQGYVRTLRAFFSWVVREGYLEKSPVASMRLPRAAYKLINTFSPAQVESLLRTCRPSSIAGQRNLAIMLLMLDTGLRVSELVSIDVADLKIEEAQVRIRRGKGSKERLVPIGSLVQKALWKYINSYRPQPATQVVTAVFLSSNGMPLTSDGVQQMVRRQAKLAGVTGVRCSPHTFRHTFAKNYLLNGGDIFSLQKILGHSSLVSVRTYLNLFAGDVKAQHQKFSPVDNLAKSPDFLRLCR